MFERSYKRHKKEYPERVTTTSWKKGQPSANPNGRPPKSKNVISKQVREKLEEALAINILTIKEDLAAMTPYNRVNTELQIIKVLYPAKKHLKQGDGTINIEVNYTPKPIVTEDADTIEIQSHDQIKND